MSACGTLNQRLEKASETKGQVEAKVNMPDLPNDCRQKEKHAPLIVGSEIRTVLRMERFRLDRQNARTDRCATFYETLKSGMEHAP